MNENNTHSFNAFLDKQLNKEQREAVLYGTGSILVVAGAGSGKTRVITARIARLLLNESATPEQILALTFTNKAATEMRERVKQFLPAGSALPFVGTFHSFCVQLLKRYNQLLDAPFFSILDEEDQERMIKEILKTLGLEKRYTARALLYIFSGIKNRITNPALPALHELSFQLQEAYALYEKQKRVSFSFDFDDLLVETLRLFMTQDEFRRRFQERVHHVLVDEYQDTNAVQHALLKQIGLADDGALAVKSLCAVGDADQSIYSWRGAVAANVQHFAADFPQTQIIKIEQNYRSTEPILELANALIVHNVGRIEKRLLSSRSSARTPLLFRVASNYQEAVLIVQALKMIRIDHADYSQAILYRTHVQSRILEEELLKASVPYTIVGGTKFYERREIKDLLAYLRLVVNPFDRAAFFRVINVPSRGIGQKAEELLVSTWQEQPLFSFHHLINHLSQMGEVTGARKHALLQFLSIFETLEASTNADRALAHILEKSTYKQFLLAEYEKADAELRIANIEELQRAVEHFKRNGVETVEQFLHEVALLQDKAAEQDTHGAPVSLMTLHASKGLEFDFVVIPGLEECVLPSQKALSDPDALEEERRLLYVGITRTRELLLLTYAQYRYLFSQVTDQMKSRFLDDMSSQIRIEIDATKTTTNEVAATIKLWILGKLRESVKTISKERPVAKVVATSGENWRKFQLVRHESYGIGTIQRVEEVEESTYLTISFKSGVRKIAAQFVIRM